ncbi:MAG TPA: FadR/GntR family transcriptional regulator [Streptosporangiaceae bacterium]|nr:FadR/GntR family transcriptional regulator [Streptosporangiaceae bacterium]
MPESEAKHAASGRGARDGRSYPAGRRSPGALRGLHGETVETIGSRIVNGYYAPGSQLPPQQLERELGISNTVLREAMRVLAAKGLVESRQKLGTVVKPRSSWSLLDADLLRWQEGHEDASFLYDLAEVRFIIEPAAARLAARRRSDQDLEHLRAALRAMIDAGTDSGGVIDADLAFHRALLYSAHNELLSRMEFILESGLRARDMLVHNDSDWPDSVPAHSAILAAVEAGDSAAAEQAVLELLDQALTDIGQADLDGGAADGATE